MFKSSARAACDMCQLRKHYTQWINFIHEGNVSKKIAKFVYVCANHHETALQTRVIKTQDLHRS